jgi:hypothetical protein
VQQQPARLVREVHGAGDPAEQLDGRVEHHGGRLLEAEVGVDGRLLGRDLAELVEPVGEGGGQHALVDQDPGEAPQMHLLLDHVADEGEAEPDQGQPQRSGRDD